MLVGSSFKTNLCLAPGLCVFDLFVLAGRFFFFFKQWTSCRCRPWQIRIRRAQALQLLGLDLEAEKLDRGIIYN